MNKYTLTPKALVTARKTQWGEFDYPLPVVQATKKPGRIVDNGINFVAYFADGSAPIPCRKLKDALLFVKICPIAAMPTNYLKGE